jgi:hypothetical protein
MTLAFDQNRGVVVIPQKPTSSVSSAMGQPSL